VSARVRFAMDTWGIMFQTMVPGGTTSYLLAKEVANLLRSTLMEPYLAVSSSKQTRPLRGGRTCVTVVKWDIEAESKSWLDSQQGKLKEVVKRMYECLVSEPLHHLPTNLACWYRCFAKSSNAQNGPDNQGERKSCVPLWSIFCTKWSIWRQRLWDYLQSTADH